MHQQEHQGIEVTLLYPELIGADLWAGIRAGIVAEESEKAARFAFEEDRRTYMAAHWLKRRVLSRADPAIHPLSWRFAYGPHGKPYLAGRGDLHVNLSHCRGLVACALRRNGPVGVDVECVDRPAPQEIIAHYFSAAEAAWLCAQPDCEQATAFFRIWTLKEAFIKATGHGLSQPLKNISVCVDPPALLPEGEWAGDAISWRLHQAKLASPHLLAVAWRHDGERDETVKSIIVRPGSCDQTGSTL